jgi:hypothetical protein
MNARLALRSARSPRSSMSAAGPHPRGLGLKAPRGEDGRIPAAPRLRRGRFLPAGLAPLAQAAGAFSAAYYAAARMRSRFM